MSDPTPQQVVQLKRELRDLQAMSRLTRAKIEAYEEAIQRLDENHYRAEEERKRADDTRSR